MKFKDQFDTQPLPCPFCGGEVSVYKVGNKYYIQCFGIMCPVRPSIDRPYDTEASIIKAWNQRHNESK